MSIVKTYGPFPNGKRFILNFEDEKGKRTSKSYKSLGGAKRAKGSYNKRATIKAEITSSIAQKGVPDYDGTLGWFMIVLAKKTEEVARSGGKEARNDLKAIASAGLAAQKLFDNTEALNELADLREAVKEILSNRRHGTRTKGPDVGAKSSAGREAPLH